MAVLPDLATAGLYAIVAFLIALGFLVVFIETISPRRMAAALLGVVVVAIGLVSLSEPGAALLVLGVGAALLANHGFEWLTTR
ncbi:MAG: hypothetical protein L3J78_02225 [Thermoplasmata archaeon]|nr:hypothetical protein [Thermoplasmata archaeon]